MFDNDPNRFSKYSFNFLGADGKNILWDFSKNILDENVIGLLLELSKEANVEGLRDRLFAGEHINFTEDR